MSDVTQASDDQAELERAASERADDARAEDARSDDHRVARPPEKLEAEARRRAIRRLRWSLATAGVTVAIGLVIFVAVTLRDKPPNACLTMLGPVEDIEQLVGRPQVLDEGIGGERDCNLRVWERDRPPTGTATVYIANKHANNLPRIRADLEGKPFGSRETMPVATGEALVFVGTEGGNAGTIEHAFVFVHGDTVTELRLDSRAFDLPRAKTFATGVAARAQQP